MDLISKLNEVSGWNSFAASLLAQHRSGKRLTPAQVSAAERMFAKMASTSAAKSEAASVDLSSVHSMFAAATRNGMKKPQFRYGDLKLSLAPATGRNAGAVYVKREGEYAGKIAGGKFSPVAGAAGDWRAIAEAVATIAADPLGAAQKYGGDTGFCACCGKLLTDDKTKGRDGLTSVQRKVGPKCAEHWGLL